MSGVDAVAPRRLYVHDDLLDPVAATHGESSPVFTLARALLARVARDTERVTVLTLAAQLEALLGHGSHAPFALALGIGVAGERVARQIQARTGWFPSIRTVDLTREEDGHGGYAVVSLSGTPLGRQLGGVERVDSLAIVDDTIFSGLTLATLLDALPGRPARTHVFCLRAVAESLPALQARCPISVGFAARGRLLEDVSFINASGLVRRGAIRRTGRPPLAFFERPEWMRAWFGDDADEIITLCRRLSARLKSD